MESNLSAAFTLPAWLPDAVRLYLDHTEEGLSLRELARREGVAASTVMRQVRRYEARRDDPLVDEALAALASAQGGAQGAGSVTLPAGKDQTDMTAQTPITLDEAGIQREARRVLRRMAEPGAVMAVAQDMEKAAVLRAGSDGRMVQTAVLERAVAQAFALKDWIACARQGRLATYEITAPGRAALRRLVEEEDRRRRTHHAACGMAEAPAAFAGWQAGATAESQRRLRVALTESPVAVLARRRDQDGRVFLEPDLVRAAERLREDYELAQMGARGAQNWEGILAGAEAAPDAPDGARARVAAALRDLGPGLGDIVLRVCCQ
ncbi:MAG: helix-turn-helix domain-containing protein, partial [Gemmobacter sp.]|nr:helix-turn-helix domain-containing protein [Gemmobacter sp.]